MENEKEMENETEMENEKEDANGNASRSRPRQADSRAVMVTVRRELSRLDRELAAASASRSAFSRLLM